MKPRALVYVRVSDEGGRGVDLLSPQIQRAACRDHCERNGYQVVDTVEDVDLSGRNWAKRQIEAQVARVEAGDVDVIVVWKWSRFARNRRDWAVAVDRIETAGGRLESATEPADATSSGRFARGVLAELAAFESERIGDGWKEAHRQRFESGLPVHGSVPWCYVSERRTLRLVPDRATVVRQLYARYIDGAGAAILAQWLQAQGQPTPSGRPWNVTVVRRMLDSPIHAGIVTYRGEQRPGAFEPVIDDDTWQAYRAQRRDRRRVGKRGVSSFLLSGLTVCGLCGHALNGTGGQAEPRYRCQHSAYARTHRAVSVKACTLDDAVLAWVADRAAGIDAAIDALPVASPVADTVMIESQIVEVDRKLGRANALLLSEVMTEHAYRMACADLAARRAELVAALQSITDRAVMSAADPVRAASNLVADWDLLPLVDQRATLRTLVDHVTVWVRPLRVEVLGVS